MRTQKGELIISLKDDNIVNMDLCFRVTKSSTNRWYVLLHRALFVGLFFFNIVCILFILCSDKKDIWDILTALLLCHVGFVHLCWPKYAFFLFFLFLLCPVVYSYGTLDQRIMHKLSLGLPEQFARAL